MLASITPLGERGRRSTWGVTVTAFLLGAVLAAAAAGAGLGALGSVALPDALTARDRVVGLAMALAAAILLDAGLARVPGPRRQVNERWLDDYRGWVYGLGYGSQLGLAVTTVVSSAATYVALVAAFLSGSAGRGAIILACFGAIRGLTPLAAAHVHSQRQLLALHAALDRWRGRVRWGAVGVEAAVLAVAVVMAAGATVR
jgi:sulfite exporter TauE/SafE